MNIEDERESQWQETLATAAVLQARPTLEPGSPAQPGELYLSRRTADFPVEWLVIERVAGGQLRVVPVDDDPLVGSRDVELPTPAVGGAAVARCGLEAVAAPSALEPELRTGVLPDTELARVRAKRGAVEGGVVEASLLEEVADGDPEYQSWLEGTLEPAVVALERPPQVVPIWSRRVVRVARSWGPALAAAAVLLMVLGLGNAVRRLDGELAAARWRVAELERVGGEQLARVQEEARQRELSEREAGRLQGLLGTAEEALQAKGDQLKRLHRQFMQALDFGAVVNPRKLVFGGKARFGRNVRGQALVMQAGSSAMAFLEVEVVDAEPYLSYRLRLVPTKGGKPVTIDGLSREGSWLRLGIENDELAVGEYWVLIDGLGFGKPVELDERYRLTVEP